VAILGLLSAFSFPLVKEGYQNLGSSTYKEAQKSILETSIRSYLQTSSEVDWNSSTTTEEILEDLKEGTDLDFDGKNDGFLPPSLSIEQLSEMFRISYKSENSFKVLIR